MIKTNIKMRVTPEQLSKISDITNRIFLDYRWNYLNIKENQVIELYTNDQSFNSCDFEEIDADLFINTNGTCEETYLTKYTSQPKDLESALKKIENLHIALNKKRDKNKNQALEITKLLEQKKDLQDKLNQANRIVKIGIDNASKLVNFLDEKDEIIKAQDNDVRMLESNLRIRNEYVSIVDEKVKELENRLKQLNSSGVTTNDTMSNYVDDLHTKLKEKDTIISYLESKLK